MSRLESNMDELEKQLAELQMIKESNITNRPKKIPPAVPPKKKAQPQVPHSAAVSALREPSFSTKITPPYNTNNNSYSTNGAGAVKQIPKNYANVGNVNIHAFGQAESRPVRNYHTYSNMPTYRNSNDDLPPPPPPPPPTLHVAVPQYLDDNYNNEILPPPSPVSSNYSELVRATNNLKYNQDRAMYPPVYQNEFPEYGGSQSSNYESLYEPINPNPHHNSSVSVNDSYHHYENNVPHPNVQKPSKSPLPKENEVDALTNMLVQSISDSQDLDVFGTCIKCNGKVVGEGAGCTAMGHIYHVKCFSCHICSVNLQGKPFYAVEGQPYCEIDYQETLEKCSVCNEPILDRILRATGKPYHPTCFTCVVCGKSLDGVPFTVDAMNQIHCIEDFHKKFAPRCCVCELPIMPEEGEEETVRVVALDRSFHVRCYCCEDCGLQLSSESEGRGCYPLDGHILCKTCNGQRIRLLTNVMTTDL